MRDSENFQVAKLRPSRSVQTTVATPFHAPMQERTTIAEAFRSVLTILDRNKHTAGVSSADMRKWRNTNVAAKITTPRSDEWNMNTFNPWSKLKGVIGLFKSEGDSKDEVLVAAKCELAIV